MYTDMRVAYGNALLELGRTNEKVVVLDADLGSSTMGRMFEDKYPDRHFELGIAEANMTSIAAGMAICGKIPFTNSFAAFAAGRSFDQIRQSIALGNVNVKIVGSSAGLSDFGDGATHQTVEDVAIMRALPNLTVLCPADGNEAYQATLAAAKHNGPLYLRISRAEFPSITPADKPFVIGENAVFHDGDEICIFASGYMLGLAVEAAKSLQGKVSAKVVNIHTVKPICSAELFKLTAGCKAVITAEEHSIVGGLGSAVAEAMRKAPLPIEFIGLNDCFGRSAHNYNELMEYFELTSEKIAQTAIVLKDS
jgi:transketolase